MSFRKQPWHTERDRSAPFTYDAESNHCYGEFESWTEWVRYCDQDVVPGLKRHASRSADHGNDWNGGSWEDALHLAWHGWESPVAETDEVARNVACDIVGDLLQQRYESVWDVSGETFDVGMYLSGEPEHWQQSIPAESINAGSVVRLIVPVTYNADVGESTVRARGTAICALMDVLRQAGYGLEIWAHLGIAGLTSQAGKPQPRWSAVIQVQRASDFLDIGTVMYAVAHPTMLRRLGFAAMERVPPGMREPLNIGSGYGHAVGAEAEDLPVFDGPTITLPLLDYRQDWGEQSIKQWIVTALRSLA